MLLVSTLIILLVLSFLSEIDQPVSAWFSAQERAPLKNFAASITEFGNAEQWFALSILTYLLCTYILKRKSAFHYLGWNFERVRNMLHWSIHLFWGLIISGVITHFVKFALGRQRPHMSADRNDSIFHFFAFHWDFHSFPSGHTQTLFCLASLVILLWPRQSFWIWLVAAFFSFTRVMVLQHFVSDVLAGAIIGISGTYLSLRIVSKRVSRPKALYTL